LYHGTTAARAASALVDDGIDSAPQMEILTISVSHSRLAVDVAAIEEPVLRGTGATGTSG
jgi:hypothetical protein